MSIRVVTGLKRWLEPIVLPAPEDVRPAWGLPGDDVQQCKD